MGLPVAQTCVRPSSSSHETFPYEILGLGYKTQNQFVFIPVKDHILYPILSCILSYPVSYPILYPILSCVLSYPASYPILYPILSCILSYTVHGPVRVRSRQNLWTADPNLEVRSTITWTWTRSTSDPVQKVWSRSGPPQTQFRRSGPGPVQVQTRTSVFKLKYLI